MERKEEVKYWEEERDTWKGINPILYKQARNKLMELGSKKVVIDYDGYKRKNMVQLRFIGKKLKVPKYYDLNEDKLINEIMKRH